eukprot:gb/GECH01013264.1/.p1 GENE.gb/GECH01013264.1/~~gb/GECH01013264.1/.p1  ORF type:complete len:205 (+),score=38.45 gb/GECH01013264.1/:1-615(+)
MFQVPFRCCPKTTPFNERSFSTTRYPRQHSEHGGFQSRADRYRSLFDEYRDVAQRRTALHQPDGAHPNTAARPTQLKVRRKEGVLYTSFNDGLDMHVPGELLRVYSPSAEVRGQAAAGRVLPGKRGVRVIGAEPVGTYAVRLTFSDGHDSGIYPFSYLYAIAKNKFAFMRAYIHALQSRKLSRNPPRSLLRRKQKTSSDDNNEN